MKENFVVAASDLTPHHRWDPAFLRMQQRLRRAVEQLKATLEPARALAFLHQHGALNRACFQELLSGDTAAGAGMKRIEREWQRHPFEALALFQESWEALVRDEAQKRRERLGQVAAVQFDLDAIGAGAPTIIAEAKPNQRRSPGP